MKLRSIQLLRAAAIILVLYAHSIDLQMDFGHSFQQDFFHLQNFGAFGVDLFFVISGFVISLSARKYKGMLQGLGFLARRFIRLNPVYYLVSVLSFLLFFRRPLTMKSILSQTEPLQKTFLLLPFFDKTHWILPVLFVGWTLSFEWLFYILFFIAILCAPGKKEWLIALLILGITGIGVICKSVDPRWIFLTSPIQLEFLLGVIIYRLYCMDIRPDHARTIARVCLATGTGYCLFLVFHGFGEDLEMKDVITGNHVFGRVLHWATVSGLLVTGLTFMEKSICKNLREKQSVQKPGMGKAGEKIGSWLLRCGDASYSIYLTHIPLFMICRSVYLRLGFPAFADLAIFGQMALALFAGTLFYKWIESPMLNWLRDRLRL